MVFYPGAKCSEEHMNITVSKLSKNEKIMLIKMHHNFCSSVVSKDYISKTLC